MATSPTFVNMKQLTVQALFLMIIATTVEGQQVEVTYKTYCGGCHGARMEGNAATALIKEKWQHGSTYTSIFKTIKFGIPKTEMKGWANTLKDKDISTFSTANK